MKYLLMFLVIFSCAQNKKQVVLDADKYEPKTLTEKKQMARKVLSNHKEYSPDQIKKIEKLLIGALEKTEQLRNQESRIIQQIMNKTIVNRGTFTELRALRKEMKRVYEAKYENVKNTVLELKQVMGISSKNRPMLDDIDKMDFFHIR